MKQIVERVLRVIFKGLISLRYRVQVKGLDTLTPENLPKKGGTLFLANHPAEIDPLILLVTLWVPFRPHPVAIDYLFRKPFLRNLLEFVGALAVPNFDGSSNSYKRRQIEKTYQTLFNHLDRGENILIYPAGSLKNGPEEVIGGASGVQTILEARPSVNVVLIRTTGLWGSSFSRAPTGKTPEIIRAFFNGFKVLLFNGIFFAPRRSITIECAPAPADFPWKGSRLEVNRYLEKWFNEGGPEPLNRVSFCRFREEYPPIYEPNKEEEVSLAQVPQEIRQKVIEEISKLTRAPLAEIQVDSDLALDLGLDSLDIAQLAVSLKEQFGITALHSSDLTTVGSVIAYAAKLKTPVEKEEQQPQVEGMWKREKNRPPTLFPTGETIPEVFLKTCDRMGKSLACVDLVAGEMSYQRLKMGVVLLAEAIRNMPGERIGIMMPASVGVNAMILATMLAGKIPVMMNWTLGERNLRSVVNQSGVQVTLSAMSFLDRLDNAELNGLDDKIVLLEDIRRKLSVWDKLKAFYRTRRKAAPLLKTFGADRLRKEDAAVILFTSGTESYPKGVPLSHHNLLTNQQGAYVVAGITSNDVLLGALPSFHSFGFSITGIFPLLVGLRVAYSPNPTDGKRVAEAVERWAVTLLCLAPTFLKNMLRVGTEKQLATLRIAVAGAEKAGAELFERMSQLNPRAMMLEGYGITECAPVLTINTPGLPVQGVGPPLPGVEIKIVDPETYAPLPIGQQGLVLAYGPNVFDGYLDSSLSSPFVTVDGKNWYHTGDLGYLDSRNYLTLTGRLKRFVKIGGEMVSLTAIEETLQQVGSKQGWKLDPELPSLAICATEMEGKKGEIHLFTTFDTTLEAANQILRESGMSNIIKIRSIKKVAYIPLLGTGKIDYRKLSAKLNG
ncbi:AMP-binding protein [Chlamydiota bacterium]